MQRSIRMLSVAAVVLGLFLLALTPAAMADERSDKILSNLQLKFPQLDSMSITMGEITPTDFDGLHQGSFTIPGRGTQNFLVSADDSKLYLVNDPIDVSRSGAEIEAELAKRAEAEAVKATELASKLEAAVEGVPMRGPADAPVTIVEFSDFQCPYCTRGANTVEEIMKKYDGDVRFVFKHFPLDFHKWAKAASIAAHCAGNQNDDAFWKLHDAYFANQRALTPENVVSKSEEYLAGTSVDMGQWKTCAADTNSDEYKAASAAVDADMELGKSLGVSGTPGFFVNGHFLNGAQPITTFEPIIEKARGGA